MIVGVKLINCLLDELPSYQLTTFFPSSPGSHIRDFGASKKKKTHKYSFSAFKSGHVRSSDTGLQLLPLYGLNCILLISKTSLRAYEV